MPELGQGRPAPVRLGAGGRPGQEELPEGPGVNETELARPAEIQHGMGVQRPRVGRRRRQELAAHAQVRHQHPPVVPLEKQVLAMAAHADQLPAGQARQRRRGVPAHGPPAADIDVDEGVAGVAERHVPPHRLDLGQLGHP